MTARDRSRPGAAIDLDLVVAGADQMQLAPSRFDEFWTAYPRKAGKKDAERLWRAVVERKGVDPDAVMAGLATAVHTWAILGTAERFIPYAATWLRGGHWEDAPAKAPTPTTPMTDRDVYALRQEIRAELLDLLGPVIDLAVQRLAEKGVTRP